MSRREILFAGGALAALFGTALVFRPLLPIDETRYLTVAWEMFLRQDWFAPLTVNFEPYHHKPPLLFWLINSAWAVFGVSRWAAMIPVALAAGGVIGLTAMLCRRLLPAARGGLVYVLLGSLPLILYSTLIMFDVTLTVFVLGSLLCLLEYDRAPRRSTVALLGLLVGLGVLAKGPVMYLYVLFPMLLRPAWSEGGCTARRWYGGVGGALLVSLLPVLAWLAPMLAQASDQFAYSLLWEQTAARLAGSQEMVHPRPVWFYLPILAFFCVPWIFFPRFWQTLGSLRKASGTERGIRFLAAWLLPTFVAFSLVGGKQPHYLLPLLPGLAIVIAWLLRETAPTKLRSAAIAVVATFVVGHAILANSVLERYELRPVAEFVAANPDRDWAFARLYRGEITFLGRLERALDVPQKEELPAWFRTHPGGLAIVTFNGEEEMSGFERLYSMPYRGKSIGIFGPPTAPADVTEISSSSMHRRGACPPGQASSACPTSSLR